ncbi:carbohydrate-binding protein [Aquimarina litoralis]|uniref:carbohydrate-binding protein n=2 Tax=Aquimarina litoralis TaxID=584605 RepID=UPI001C565571|nr:carbohydrate-binding protein [Aquimarina litoralis]
MKKINFIIVMGLFMLFPIANRAQNVEVDVNLNIKHSVGGISDFGRERHITNHASIFEADYEGEINRVDELLNELDVTLGRDNGTSSFLFQFTPVDEERPNKHDRDSLSVLLDFWQEEYQRRLEDRGLTSFKGNTTSIMGTNPHPTYPTLSYFDNGICGSNWGRENGQTWIPQDIETSAEWMVQFMDEFFVDNISQDGIVMPEYWEVINEPDFPLNTGQFMMSSWEDIFEYHNLVAVGVKEKLGSRAPKIGGMTWGLHDLFNGDGFSRFQSVDYVNGFYGNTPADELAKAYARSQVDKPSFFIDRNQPWFQWDVMWKGFIDIAGANMDFYSVHFYDWPTYDATGGTTRSGGHVEATLEMLESYDINKFGTRKPVIISEYGAVQNAWDDRPHDRRYDWENLKPFSNMLMQFLERPDYIELSMPFTLTKATFRDVDNNGDGIPEIVYHYKMLRDDDGDGNWEWSDMIKWYRLWDDVDGTRVDTMSSDPDIQVDCYIDGKDVFLILNNLEDEDTNINLNFFEDFNNQAESVRIKQLFLQGVRDVTLSDDTTTDIPSTVTLRADATMVLKYTFANEVNINESSTEKKFYGASVSNDQRVEIQSGDNTFFVNGVEVPQNPDNTEAMLKITANLFDAADDVENGFLSIKKLVFNGVEVETPIDWRGGRQNRSRWFGALEIPVPANLVRQNNTIVIDFQHVGEVCVVNLLTWEFTKKPGRSDEGPGSPDPISVTGVAVSPATISLDPGDTTTLTATVAPSNATDKTVTWSSSNTSVASVSTSGVVTALTMGSAIITATTVDGNFTATSTITVNDTSIPPSGDQIIIEAEDFIATGGTFNDASAGGPGLGVNATATNINYVNSGDYAEYTINVGNPGAYRIAYEISTPSDNAQIQLLIDGTVVATDNVPNNGQWDDYNALVSSSTISNLTAGVHTVRVVASGSNPWQWNLDKIILTRITGNTQVDGGTITGGPFVFTVGDGIADNVSGITLSGNSGTNSQWVVTDDQENILGLPPTPEAVNFDEAGDGSCFIYHLSYENGITGLNSGANLSGLSGNFDLSNSIEVIRNSATPPDASLIIEAEDFITTGGTFDDAFAGGPGLGVNRTPTNINYVNNGDWAEYTINVTTAATYNIEYLISTPSSGAQIQLLVDGTLAATSNVPSNGAWDNFTSLVDGTVTLSSGTHTIRIQASSNTTWQWNLDKIVLSTGAVNRINPDTTTKPIEPEVYLFPNPTTGKVFIQGLSQEKQHNIRIYDIKGATYVNQKLNENHIIDIQSLPQGIYFLTIVNPKDGNRTLKLIKK